MIKVEELWFKYPYQKDWLFRNLNLEISSKTMVFVGKNGAGKTTLLRLIMGLEKPQKGFISYNGEIINKSISRKIFYYIPVNPRNVLLGPTVRDEFLSNIENNEQFDLNDVKTMLKGSGLENKLDTKIMHLSEGELRLLATVSAIISNKKVIVLDEPTIGLDSSYRKKLLKFMKNTSKKTFIVASNDLRFILHFNEMALIKDGNVFLIGKPINLFLDKVNGELLRREGFDYPLISLVRKIGLTLETFDEETIAKKIIEHMGL